MAGTKLVIGASGFLGSHLTKQLIAGGERDVRVLIRTTGSTRGTDGLPVDRRYGDIFDTEALRAAMAGCDVVYYCVVDARPWLRDAARAMILAGERGAVGQRYVVSERFMSTREVHELGCAAVKITTPKLRAPIGAIGAAAHFFTGPRQAAETEHAR